MSTVSHPPARSTSEHSWFELLHVREMWASLAIAAMWIAVACSAAWGPDFVSTTGSGTNSTTIPSGIAVALFASIGTWAVAKYGSVVRGRAATDRSTVKERRSHERRATPARDDRSRSHPTGRGSAAGSSSHSRSRSSSPTCSRSTATCSTGSMRSSSWVCSGCGRARPGYDLRAAVRRRWPLAVGLGVVCAGVMALDGRSHRGRDHPPRRCRARRSSALARRRLRHQRRPAPLGVPHPRRLRRPGRKQAERSRRRQGRDRCDRADRIACDDGRLPPRLQRLPLGQGCQAAGRRRPVERPDPRHAEPDRRADRTCRPARVRRPAQLRHGHVPAAARLRRGSRSSTAAPAGVAADSRRPRLRRRADRARGHGVREQPRRHLDGGGRARRRRHRGGDDSPTRGCGSRASARSGPGPSSFGSHRTAGFARATRSSAGCPACCPTATGSRSPNC